MVVVVGGVKETEQGDQQLGEDEDVYHGPGLVGVGEPVEQLEVAPVGVILGELEDEPAVAAAVVVVVVVVLTGRVEWGKVGQGEQDLGDEAEEEGGDEEAVDPLHTELGLGPLEESKVGVESGEIEEHGHVPRIHETDERLNEESGRDGEEHVLSDISRWCFRVEKVGSSLE